MESATRAHHFILDFPEIISRIMKFLSTSDLESSSLINPTWENVALEHLLIRNPVDIQLNSDINDSTELTTLANLSPKYVKILTSDDTNFDILLPKLALLHTLNLNAVKKLEIELNLDNVGYYLVKICESLKNLRTLEIKLSYTIYKKILPADHPWQKIFPNGDTQTAKKLRTLSIHMFHSSWKDKVLRCETAVCVATRILHVFRHLQHLRLSGIPALPLLNMEGINLPQLESLSTETIRGLLAHERFLPFLQSNHSPRKTIFANVTRLEFSLLAYSEPDDFKDLLTLLAPQLRHFCISRISSVCSSGTVVVPILPKLKVFEICRRQNTCMDSTLYLNPGLTLNFESGVRDEVQLVYRRQFPALEKLIVRVAPQRLYDKLDKAIHFEATVVFLSEGLEPCETLKNLDISIPTVDEVNLRRKKRHRLCTCGVKVCGYCSCVEDMSDIYDRIITIFPKLEDHLVERQSMKERSADIKMFKELADKLGISDGNDFNRMFKK